MEKFNQYKLNDIDRWRLRVLSTNVYPNENVHPNLKDLFKFE